MSSHISQTDHSTATEDAAISLPVYVQRWPWPYLVLAGMLFVGIPLLLALVEPVLWFCMGPVMGGVIVALIFVYHRRRHQIRYVALEREGVRLASEDMRARGADHFIPWAEVKLVQFAPYVPRAPDEPSLLEGVEVVTAEQRRYFVITPDVEQPKRFRHLLLERAQQAFATDQRTGEIIPPHDPQALADASTVRVLAEQPIRRFYRFALWATAAAACLPAILALYLHVLFGPFGGEAFWPVLWTTLSAVALGALGIYAGHRRVRRLRESWRNMVTPSPATQP